MPIALVYFDRTFSNERKSNIKCHDRISRFVHYETTQKELYATAFMYLDVGTCGTIMTYQNICPVRLVNQPLLRTYDP